MLLDDRRYRGLITTRVVDPGRVAALAAERRRRPRLAPSGRLCIVAADHPARGQLRVGEHPLAMADRRELLDRLLITLATPGIDGVLAAPDVMEDLLLLGALHDRLAIGSMNRGGLDGATFELDDRFTAYDPETIAALRLDGGKMLLRLDDRDAASLDTLEASAAAVSGLAARGLIALIEPLPARRDDDGRLRIDESAEALIRAVAIASGLGNTSAYTWLKLPAIDEMARVAAATTLPLLLLGGDPGSDPERVFEAWEQALALPNVVGLVAGRMLLYPPDGDVAGAARRAAELVHGGDDA